MARQIVNIGSSANKGNGDPLRTAFDKINDNFAELYGATTLDLDNVGSSIIPSADATYALGSSTKRWTDLHVRDFVYIGAARLQADADGNLVVNGGTVKIDGDVSGSLFADDSTLAFDAQNGVFHGKFDGDLTGSVSTDDSTVIIDGINGKVTPSSFLAPRMTQTQIDAITPEFGMMVYNTTTGKFQGYAADANNDSTAGWADLH